MDNVCIFCLWHRDNVAEHCTYHMHHEFPSDVATTRQKQVVKPDGNLCIKCGLHPRNPKAVDCDHEFAK